MQVTRMLDTQVNLTEDFLSERCCAFLRFAKFCGNLGLKSSRKTSNCVAYGAKQVVPLSLQNEFVLTRVTCRFLRNGAINSLFRFAKEGESMNVESVNLVLWGLRSYGEMNG